MSFSLGSMVSPKAGLAIVKVAIEKTIKQKIERFDMIYKHKEKIIDFRLYNYVDEHKDVHPTIVMQWADGASLCKTLETMMSDKINKRDEINFAVVSYPENKLDVFIVRDGEKKKLTYQL